MTAHQIAQFNIAGLKFPHGAPEMAGFIARLDEVNALADAASEFGGRLQTGEGHAAAIDFFGTDLLLNLNFWKSILKLQDFTFRAAHREVLVRREQWLDPMRQAYSVVWWFPAGKVPSLGDAARRVESLRWHGPTEFAFNFRQRFELASGE